MVFFTCFEGQGYKMEANNETTKLHSIHLKFFPFQKCKQKVLYEEGLLSIESSYLKIRLPQRSTMLKNIKMLKNVKN